ncbi:hypothetical protein HMPREF1548_02804 [Clostridium sp. KLE 1755]|nr:hypothetical protein HMPREF1548_02804 [Clostridium sp. KLE 1755]
MPAGGRPVNLPVYHRIFSEPFCCFLLFSAISGCPPFLFPIY